MTRGRVSNQPRVQRTPAEQTRYYLDLYRDALDPAAHARVITRADELGLVFPEEELQIIAALDTPAKVQEFLNTRVYYHNDHSSEDQEETAIPPRLVLQTGAAHCFEGALFAYAVNFLQGHSPRMVLLESSQDSDHNLVVYQDPTTGLWGSNAHSGYPHLDGRPAQYPTVRALAESYYPYYYSDYSLDPNDLTLVGYSEPFDLVDKYGPAWIATEKPVWDIYYTYVDAQIRLHYLFDDSGASHSYPVIRALQERWIEIDQGKAAVNVGRLPPEAQAVWHAFWRVYDSREKHARGEAREIEKKFMRLTGTTPIDLQDNAEDMQDYVDRGHTLEQLGIIAKRA